MRTALVFMALALAGCLAAPQEVPAEPAPDQGGLPGDGTVILDMPELGRPVREVMTNSSGTYTMNATDPPPEAGGPGWRPISPAAPMAVQDLRLDSLSDSRATFSWRLHTDAELISVGRDGTCPCPSDPVLVDGRWTSQVDDFEPYEPLTVHVLASLDDDYWRFNLHVRDGSLVITDFSVEPGSPCFTVTAGARSPRGTTLSLNVAPVDTTETWNETLGLTHADAVRTSWCATLKPTVADATYRFTLIADDGRERVTQGPVDVRATPYAGTPIENITISLDGPETHIDWDFVDDDPGGPRLWLVRDGAFTEQVPMSQGQTDHDVTLRDLAPGEHVFVLTWRDGLLHATDLQTITIDA